MPLISLLWSGGRLLRTGPDEAWALLQNLPEALGTLTAAGDWLRTALAALGKLAGSPCYPPQKVEGTA